MSTISSDIDRIVAEVVRRLQSLTVRDSTIGVDSVVNTEASKPATDLVLNDRLVTLAQIEGRLAGIKRLIVVANAVVTPALVDEIRGRKITLERSGITKVNLKSAGTPIRNLVVPVVRIEVLATREDLIRMAIGNEIAIYEASNWMGARNLLLRLTLQHSRPVIVVTDKPFLATSECNRYERLRAAYVSDANWLSQAESELTPNVIVIRPNDDSLGGTLRWWSEGT